MDVETGVREFLQEHVSGRDATTIGRDESLLDSGLLDSASILELVAFVEGRFGIEVPDEELVPDNFETIDAITAVVKTKQGQQAAGGNTSG